MGLEGSTDSTITPSGGRRLNIRVLSAVKPKEGASKGSLSQRVWTLSEGGRGKPAVMDRK